MADDAPDQKSSAGRPTDYTQDLAIEICAELASGRSLVEICSREGMPSQSTVYRWLLKDKEFCENYTRARRWQAETIADETLAIADDARNDWMERHAEDGQSAGWQLNGEHVQRSRLRIDQRKWYAGKLDPKKYGDKIDLNHGSDPDRPVVQRIERVIVNATDKDRQGF